MHYSPSGCRDLGAQSPRSDSSHHGGQETCEAHLRLTKGDSVLMIAPMQDLHAKHVVTELT